MTGELGTSQRTKSFWSGRLSRALWIGVAASILVGVAGVSLFAGFVVAEHELFPHRLLSKFEARVEKTIRFQGWTPQLRPRTYSTAFLTLVSDVGVVDIGRNPSDDPDADRLSNYATLTSQTGGGLTSFGVDVLLLPFNGVIYAASSSRDIRATGIAAPDNHRAAFSEDARRPEYADYDFRVGQLRYNDLLFVDTPSIRALIASYIDYRQEDHCYTNTLARLDIGRAVTSIDDVRARPEDWQIFFRSQPCLPLKSRYVALEGMLSGGRMDFAEPTTIYLTSGDFHLDGMRSEGPPIAQDPHAQYGKILAVDLATGASRILSMGHRNPSGIVRTPEGQVFVAEHGPRGGDELNLIRSGANYGWPLESYGTTYYGFGIPGAFGHGRHETFTPPAFAWLPSVATSSITFVRGFSAAWDGDLLVGTLKDRSLHRVRLAGSNGVYSERIEIGSRIRDVHQHSDGRLVLWTDNEELVFLTARERTNIGRNLTTFANRHKLGGDAVARLETALDGCAECHSFEVDDNTGAPSLARIYGDEIASSDYQEYSAALKGTGGTWTRAALTAFLKDPERFAPGTKMPRPDIGDDAQRERLIDFLEYMDLNF